MDGAAARPRGGRLVAEILWRAFTLMWLLYLVYPVSQLIGGREAYGMKVLELGLATAFVALYAYRMAGPRPAVDEAGEGVGWPSLAALAALATAVVLLPGANWLGMYIYVSAAAGTMRPMRHAWLAILGTLALALAVAWRVGTEAFGPGVMGTAFLVSEILAIGGMVAGMSRLVQANAELRRGRDAAARLAVSEERLRIARDLHDLLGHQLAVIVLKSELAARLAEADGRAGRVAAEVREIESLARAALQGVRDAVAAYHQPRLKAELAGLRLALESAGARVTVVDESPPLSPPAEAVLAWGVREAATNILRHSRATAVDVRLALGEGGQAVLEVVDDGPALGPPAPETAGHGLVGLRERARSVGGNVEAGPTASGGFRLAVTVPAGTAGKPAVGGGTEREATGP
ncbi:MAG: sensor histidine kinase [Firmicutes bacterium]|nr:sensor histidine kinase [Bacillota bacterium]